DVYKRQLLTIMNTEALGTSPRMTFIKHKS
ncbi:hypothetical protein G6X98_06370, partial [Staphylococcus aureus]|nr:hypothetical protein [Staphylococcus aureus]